MGINKFVYYGETKFDISADTVDAASLLTGRTAHNKAGEAIEGACTYDADTSDATASIAEILNGKTAYVNGAKIEGTMPNIGKQTGSISTKAGTVAITKGFHDGSGSVGLDQTEASKLLPGNIKNGISLFGIEGNYTGESTEVPQSKTVTPTKNGATITPDAGYTCLSQVVINAIPYSEQANAAGGTTITIG